MVIFFMAASANVLFAKLVKLSGSETDSNDAQPEKISLWQLADIEVVEPVYPS